MIQEKEQKLKELSDLLKVKEKELKPLKDEINLLKSDISKLKENEKFKDFDDVMRKYYTHKLPKAKGSDLTYLHNFWNNRKDEDNMRKLFRPADMDRYRTYNVSEMLWEYSCAESWLESRDVSEKTIKGLSMWYDLQTPKYLNEQEFQETSIKLINDIPEEERDTVLEYMRLFYNIIISECVCDW